MPSLSEIGVPIKQAVLTPIGVDLGPGGQGLQAVGQVVSALGQKIKAADDNRDVARGTAEYNNLINVYNASLATKDPDEYMDGFEDLQSEISKITKDMSSDATDVLQNRFIVQNELNRAHIQNRALKDKVSIAKQEIPIRLEDMVAAGQIEEAELYLEGYRDSILNDTEVELWKNTLGEMVDDNEIFKSINAVMAEPSQQNINAARNIINDLSRTEEDKLRNMITLNARLGSKTRSTNEAIKAQVNNWADQAGASASHDVPVTAIAPPELETAKTMINNRMSTGGGGIKTSDNVTFESMEEQSLAGKFFTDKEMFESFAGSEAGGMSAKEYEQLKKINEENRTLSNIQRDTLAAQMENINVRFLNVKSLLNSKLKQTVRSRARSVLLRDILALKREVKQMILNKEPLEDVDTAIEARFEGSSKKYIRGWWGRTWKWGVKDFNDSVLGATSRDAQNTIILDILKDMANTGKVPDNFDDLIELFSD